MEALVRYRQVLRDLLHEYAQYTPSVGEVAVEIIIDEAQGHYELLFSGWSGPFRIHGSVLHFDIRGDKIWIQSDGTEEGIANRLVEAGIPKEQIVLAFKPPEIRPHTGFAVA
jgi:hypothetical protein